MKLSSLRSVAGRARAAVKVHLRKGNALERALYYRVFSDAFARERLVVARGHQEYTRTKELGRQEFLLRRNIHMIEKGLTMRPRRTTFAVDYVGETVTLFGRLVEQRPAVLSVEVENWAREVLTRYVEATAESENDVVVEAKTRFLAMQWGAEGDPQSGPHAPFTDAPPVDIDALTSLAVRRKSVRWFLPKKVERDVVDRAMLVAAEAPSACNRQPFSFRIFDDPEKVQAVAKIPMGTAGYGQNVPAIAVIVGDMSAFIDERDRHLIYTDGCLAAMSFILGLESQGVASVCINWPDIAVREKRMGSLLNLKPHERVVMLVGFGYADESGLTPFSAKRSLEHLRSYNQL
jgi:nitroreductase